MNEAGAKAKAKEEKGVGLLTRIRLAGGLNRWS